VEEETGKNAGLGERRRERERDEVESE